MGSLVTSAFALAGLIVARIKCKYARDSEGNCNDELTVERIQLENGEVAIITKRRA